jgi:hypothetical protein
MPLQILTLTLDGITAADYLAWIRDPEPPALGFSLRSVSVRAEPLGDSIEVALCWRGDAPGPAEAAHLAGFPLSAEVRLAGTRGLAAAA